MSTLLALRPLLAVCVSAVAALIIILIGDRVKPNTRETITFIAAALKFICVYSMLPLVLAGETPSVRVFEIVDGIDLYFKADAFGMIFACVASFLWIIDSVYSIGYMRGHGEKNQTGFFASFAMCLCGTMGICFAGNLVTFFIFFEVLTISTYPLVAHYRDQESRRSGRRYLLYTLTSGQLFFAGIVYVYCMCGTTDFAPGGFIGNSIPASAVLPVFLLMSVAGAVKAGVMPLHSWLPAAMVAPTPVSALLHAVAVVNAGAFALVRVMLYTFGPELCKESGGSTIISYLAACTIILASLIAMQKTNLKARLAYSTVSQLSYIVLGTALLSPYCVEGAMYHMLAHAFLKITLFMCAGAIMVTTHKKDIREMYGIGRRMPFTMAAFTVASFGIAGLPFVPAFLSKFSLLSGAYDAGLPLFIIVFIASALLALLYLVPVGYLAFADKDDAKIPFTAAPFTADEDPLKGSSHAENFLEMQDTDSHIERFKTDCSKLMLVPLLITISISLILGVYPDFGAHVMTLARIAAESIF